jgi:hypothetical protein
MKPNILVPMAGLGSRFIKEGFKVPKQLINIKDKHLIDISLDCLNYEDCNLIFVVRDETVYNFHIDELLKKKFGEDIKIVIIDKLTDGSVSSCLYAEEYIDNDAFPDIITINIIKKYNNIIILLLFMLLMILMLLMMILMMMMMILMILMMMIMMINLCKNQEHPLPSISI